MKPLLSAGGAFLWALARFAGVALWTIGVRVGRMAAAGVRKGGKALGRKLRGTPPDQTNDTP
ncbi:MAG: hypothetical protein OXG19_02750 [Chloroflexi bacterium]|nr:hypothetical protein [Chloroflexota bacterium]